MVCLKLSEDFNMVKAGREFFELHPAKEIPALAELHRKEMEGIYQIALLDKQVAPANRTKGSAERDAEIKEKMVEFAYALAEKYPELHTKIKRIRTFNPIT